MIGRALGRILVATGFLAMLGIAGWIETLGA